MQQGLPVEARTLNMPWALDMARYCLDLRTGRMLNWPRGVGGWHHQYEFELDAMDIAWRTFQLYTAKKWARVPGAAELALWLEGDHPEDEYDSAYLERLLIDGRA
ncbi:MAG: hypothetical protein L0332_06830 [Chloroflexi bacterium]|nr:hypothetical protein [Chloroflexota bacterium]